MPMAAAQHGINGVLGGIAQQRSGVDALLNARPGEYIAMSQADMRQVALARSMIPGDMLANAAVGQQLRYLQNAVPMRPAAKNRAGQTYAEWRECCDARQALADVSGHPIGYAEQRTIEAERLEWEQINGQ